MLPTLEQAIAKIKAGDKVTGREYLADILQNDPSNEKAWLWLAAAVESDERRRYCLERVLEINPDNQAARRGLATLPPSPAPPPTEARPSPEITGPLLSRIASRQAAPAADIDVGPVKAAGQPPAPVQPDVPVADFSIEPPQIGAVVIEPETPPTTEPPGLEPGEQVPQAEAQEIEEDIGAEEPLVEPPLRFWQTERGMLLTVGGAAVLLLVCAACVVAGLVFRPVAGQLPATLAAAVGTATYTPTATPTPTDTPTATFTPTPTPTVTPSPTSTQVVADTPTVTLTPTRTPTSGPNLDEAVVVEVIAGDLIKVRLEGAEVQVKYLLIAAPAVNDLERGTEPFGAEALALNRQLVEGQTVRLEKDVSETDESGRLLRYVYVGEVLVNEELLRQGLARLDLNPADLRYATRFQEVEQAARLAKIGLWSVEGDGGF
ncbi:MAG: thermonuclease family protein [Chloroflexota bacterium]